MYVCMYLYITIAEVGAELNVESEHGFTALDGVNEQIQVDILSTIRSVSIMLIFECSI